MGAIMGEKFYPSDIAQDKKKFEADIALLCNLASARFSEYSFDSAIHLVKGNDGVYRAHVTLIFNESTAG